MTVNVTTSEELNVQNFATNEEIDVQLETFRGPQGPAGADGVGIASIVQTTTSAADGGSNVWTATLTNGTKSTFTVRNGSKGSTGANGSIGPQGPAGKDGHTPVRGTDYWTAADKQEIVSDVLAALPNASGVSF